ncbi:uncharacterized protein [Glycine max]|uniref:uncharacterized protein n=1 Tax=Glycine max TaxID=3847 RepID=UPI000E21BFEF|nr:uncharacterized protein LOC112999604 [Glycine max]|eukprot:XP_025981710.1 uncharacterized protein LOC112999604 [Glycine max]
MTPYEALYGRRCRTPLCWLEPGENRTLGPEVVQQTTEKVDPREDEKYIHDPSHVIKLDGIQVKENLTYETLPLRIEDRQTKHLRGKEIMLVKVIWGGTPGEDAMWELEFDARSLSSLV